MTTRDNLRVLVLAVTVGLGEALGLWSRLMTVELFVVIMMWEIQVLAGRISKLEQRIDTTARESSLIGRG